jgi:O-antigen/teichoic acid export membrane protein
MKREMRKELVSLSKDTIIYGTSTVISRFLNFLLVPFYVNVLATTAEYGIASSLYAWMAFLNVIYPLGLEGSFFRYASRGENEDIETKNQRNNFSSPFNLVAIFSLLLSVSFILLAPRLAEPIFHNPKTNIEPMIPMLTNILRYSAVILLFDGMAILPFASLRLEHRPKVFASIKLINVVVTLIFNFYLILFLHTGVEGIFIANLIASVLTFILLVPTFIKYWWPKFDRAVLAKMLPFGLTNVPANLGAMMVQVIDRPIVQVYLGLGAVGVYQANYRMGFIMMVFVSLFEYAWRPFFMRQHKTDDEKARILFSRIFTYFMVIALIAFLLLSFFLPYILSTPVFGRRLLRADYLVGMNIIPVVLFAYIFQGMYTNFIAGIYIKERNKVLPYITGLGAIVNVGVNMILIPRIGIMGGAIATLAAYMVMALAIYIESQKVYPVIYEWGRVTKLFAMVGLAYGVERLLVVEKIITTNSSIFILRCGLALAVIVGLFPAGFFTHDEKQFLRRLMKKTPRMERA